MWVRLLIKEKQTKAVEMLQILPFNKFIYKVSIQEIQFKR